MTDYAQPPGGWLERRFRFSERGTTLPRDTMAGVTTFIVISYIIFVNPQILSFAGIEGPALIIVGYMMMTALTEAEDVAEGGPGRKLAGIDFTDLGIGLAAALTIMVMPFTFLDRRRHRVRVHHVRARPCGEGPLEGRPPVHVGGERCVRALLPRSVPAGHVRLDLIAR